MTINYPTINGHYFSFASIEIDVEGTKLRGFKEINWEQSVEAGAVYGTHPQQLGDTRGKLECSGSLSMFYPEWMTLRKQLGDGYMRKRFTVTVIMSETGGPESSERVALNGVRITKVNPSLSEGTDPVEVSLDLHIMWIEEGDEKPFEDMLI